MSICNVCESCVYCEDTPLGNTVCQIFNELCYRYAPCFFYVPLDGEEEDE